MPDYHHDSRFVYMPEPLRGIKQVDLGTSTYFVHWLKDYEYLLLYKAGTLAGLVKRFEDGTYQYKYQNVKNGVARFYVANYNPLNIKCTCPTCENSVTN